MERRDVASRYRPQLDGIRALAVTLVVAFHLGLGWLPGGFIGVDVFFVLSGYLITGLLMAEASATGRVALTRFYARRARRLLPAAVTVVMFVVVIGKYTSTPLDYPMLRRHAMSAVLYVANWDASAGTSYFAADVRPGPLLHFWSLAVEEQFYVVWPAVVIGCLWLARRRSNRLRFESLLAIVCGVVTVGSIAAALLLTPSSAAYYGTHTRAFELSAGALLAIACRRIVGGAGTSSLPTHPGIRKVAAAMTGLGALAAGGLAMSIDGGTSYPGWAAVMVTVAALALIAGAEAAPASLSGKALAGAVPAWLGRLSYSIYLWHWPLIVYFGDDLPWPALVGLILLVAQASYTLIEQPLRTRALPRLPNLTVIASGVTTSALIGLLVIPGYLANSQAEEEMISELSHQEVVVKCLDDAKYDAAHLSCVLHRGAGPTVALVGDSHADMWIPALLPLAVRHGWTLIKTTHPGCPANDVHQEFQDRERECATWRDEAYSELVSGQRLDFVILASRSYQVQLEGDAHGLAPGDPEHLSAWGEAWDRTLKYFAATDARVGVMQVQPTFPQGILACLSTHRGQPDACDFPLSSDPLLADYAERMRDVVADHPGTTLLDPTPWICPEGECPAFIDGEKVHIDDNHVGEEFSAGHSRELGNLLRTMGRN